MSEMFDLKKFPSKLMNSLENAVIVLNSSGNIVWVNAKYKELTSLSDSEVLGRHIDEVMKDGSCIPCHVKCEFWIKEVETNYGKVLVAQRTNGLEHEYKKFDGIFKENTMKLKRMKTWLATQTA